MKTIKGYHFARDDATLGYGDGRQIVEGETLTVDCEPALCKVGLHTGLTPLGALRYAAGNTLCYVELSGVVDSDEDKAVGTSRTALKVIPSDVGAKILRRFARLCALDVIHMWDAPDVVVRYLRSGDESLQDAAGDAARAAGDAAWAAARDAAWAADGAARAAARDAAWAAAGDAAWAAGDAAGAAGDAAWARQNRRLSRMIHAAHRGLHERDS